MTVVGIDHVQLAMPRGGEEEARIFYADFLGLKEVAKPPALASRGGCWFTGPSVAIHLGVEEAFVAARKAHPALTVRDLDAVIERARAAEIDVTQDDSEMGIRRCYVADPFGNRVELVDAMDAGFTHRRPARA